MIESHHDHAHCAHSAEAAGPETDPVCGMKVDPETARHSFEHDGKTHYFCSAGCRAKFAGDPEHYLAGRHREPMADAPEGAIYTCPMHPQVRQIGPGSCPICGMALEPETVSLETGPDPEYIDMLRRFHLRLRPRDAAIAGRPVRAAQSGVGQAHERTEQDGAGGHDQREPRQTVKIAVQRRARVGVHSGGTHFSFNSRAISVRKPPGSKPGA